MHQCNFWQLCSKQTETFIPTSPSCLNILHWSLHCVSNWWLQDQMHFFEMQKQSCKKSAHNSQNVWKQGQIVEKRNEERKKRKHQVTRMLGQEFEQKFCARDGIVKLDRLILDQILQAANWREIQCEEIVSCHGIEAGSSGVIHYMSYFKM